MIITNGIQWQGEQNFLNDLQQANTQQTSNIYVNAGNFNNDVASFVVKNNPQCNFCIVKTEQGLTGKQFGQILQIVDYLKNNNCGVVFKNQFNQQVWTAEQVFAATQKLNSWAAEINNAVITDAKTGQPRPLSNFEKYLYAYKLTTNFNCSNQTINTNNAQFLTGVADVCVGHEQLLAMLCGMVGVDCKLQTIVVENLTEDESRANHQNCQIALNDDVYNIHGTFYADPCWDAIKPDNMFKYTTGVFTHCFINFFDLQKIYDDNVCLSAEQVMQTLKSCFGVNQQFVLAQQTLQSVTNQYMFTFKKYSAGRASETDLAEAYELKLKYEQQLKQAMLTLRPDVNENYINNVCQTAYNNIATNLQQLNGFEPQISSTNFNHPAAQLLIVQAMLLTDYQNGNINIDITKAMLAFALNKTQLHNFLCNITKQDVKKQLKQAVQNFLFNNGVITNYNKLVEIVNNKYSAAAITKQQFVAAMENINMAKLNCEFSKNNEQFSNNLLSSCNLLQMPSQMRFKTEAYLAAVRDYERSVSMCLEDGFILLNQPVDNVFVNQVYNEIKQVANSKK